MYCCKMSAEQYARQSQRNTEQSIVSLVQAVIDNTTIPLKDKQKHIKRFQKHHADIMAEYFADIV